MGWDGTPRYNNVLPCIHTYIHTYIHACIYPCSAESSVRDSSCEGAGQGRACPGEAWLGWGDGQLLREAEAADDQPASSLSGRRGRRRCGRIFIFFTRAAARRTCLALPSPDPDPPARCRPAWISQPLLPPPPIELELEPEVEPVSCSESEPDLLDLTFTLVNHLRNCILPIIATTLHSLLPFSMFYCIGRRIRNNIAVLPCSFVAHHCYYLENRKKEARLFACS